MMLKNDTQSSVWNTEVQKINTVIDMAKSKFFWLPLLAIALLSIMFSDVFLGIRNIEIETEFLTTVFDLNVAKILVSIAFIFLTFGMLQGKGRRIGGWFFLVAALFSPTGNTIPINSNGVSFDFPMGIFFTLVSLSCWYILTFYAHEKVAPVGKIFKTCISMTIFMIGVSNIMIFTAEMSSQATSFGELFRGNEFDLSFTVGLGCMLSALTLLRKDIIESNGTAKLFAYALQGALFALPIYVLLYSIWGYIGFDRKGSFPPASWVTLEITIVLACAWLLILLYMTYVHQVKNCTNENSKVLLGIPLKVFKRIAQTPLWVFMASLMFSDIFFGVRNISLPFEMPEEVVRWSFAFDLNIFKITVGVAILFMLTKLLQNLSRQIAGWVCFGVAILFPISGAFPLIYNGVEFDLPIRMLYSATFLSAWFILIFYAHKKEVLTSNIIKAIAGIFLFVSGVFTFMTMNAYMNSLNATFSEMFRGNGFNLHFALGFVFILSAITLLWKDISNGEGASKIVCDILYWNLFVLPVVFTMCSIAGYIVFDRQLYPNPKLWLTLEQTLLISCLWMLLLFHSMYRYRLFQGTSKKDLHFVLAKHISVSVMNIVVQSRMWIFFLALLFSDVFLGFRNIQSVGESFGILIDLNLFKIATAVVMLALLNVKLENRVRLIGGWICFLLAFFAPVSGFSHILFDGIQFPLPSKLFYTLIFLCCWFALVFHNTSYSANIPKIVAWMSVFMFGIIGLMIFRTSLDNYAVTMVDMLANNTFNLSFVLGVGLTFVAITFLWKDIFNGESKIKIVSELLFWSAFFIPIALSLFMIWGYMSLFADNSLARLSEFALNLTVFLASAWVVMLFRSMYKHRVQQGVEPKDSYYLLSRGVPAKVLDRVFQVPIWTLLAAAPMVVIFFFNLFG